VNELILLLLPCCLCCESWWEMIIEIMLSERWLMELNEVDEETKKKIDKGRQLCKSKI